MWIRRYKIKEVEGERLIVIFKLNLLGRCKGGWKVILSVNIKKISEC